MPWTDALRSAGVTGVSCLLLLLPASLSCRDAAADEPAPEAPGLRAGAAQVRITPPPDVPMAGYYHVRLADGVHDDLFSKALVLECGDAKAALVALDLIGTHREFVEEARTLIEQRTGIPAANVMISATHAHTGPVIVRRSARDEALGGASGVAIDYMRDLPGLIAESVKLADDRLAPARLRAGEGRNHSLPFNRRFHMKDGTFGWNPGKGNPNILRPAGPVDPAVPTVLVEGEDGNAIACYVNFAMHLDTVGGTEISADYPHVLARSLAAVKGDDLVTLFTIGCAGDINHIDVNWPEPQGGQAEAARIGTILAGAVVETFSRLGDVAAAPGALRGSREIVAMPLFPLSDDDLRRARLTMLQGRDDRAVPFREIVQAYRALDVERQDGRPLEAEVQVIALGRDLAWVGLPGEIFVELGLALKAASPFRHTIIAELANGSVGYVPTRQAYAQGEYEVISARMAAGSGEAMVETAIRLLRAAFAAHADAAAPSAQ